MAPGDNDYDFNLNYDNHKGQLQYNQDYFPDEEDSEGDSDLDSTISEESDEEVDQEDLDGYYYQIQPPNKSTNSAKS